MSSIGDSAASETPVIPHRVIVGPTAAGKSALAMHLARARGLAIVSADSRQVYQGFDIGTAKPSVEDRAVVPHYGIDVVSPTARYSAHAWAADATRWSDVAWKAGTPPVIVGGTGLYIKALVAPFAPVPSLEPGRRAALAEWLDSCAVDELARWCVRLDPARAHLGRTQLLRAIETALLDGTRISDALQSHSGPNAAPAAPVRYLLVDPGPVLASRIASRVHQMIADGFVHEVERLMRTVAPEAPAWSASGYRVLRDALAAAGGARATENAIERVIIETRQYAKRQRTWFRHQLSTAQVTPINPDAPDALDQALAWWDAADTDTDTDTDAVAGRVTQTRIA